MKQTAIEKLRLNLLNGTLMHGTEVASIPRALAMEKFRSLPMLCLALPAFSIETKAQNAMAWQELHVQRMSEAARISASDDSIFVEKTSLETGAASFLVTDVGLTGSSCSLDVSLRRSMRGCTSETKIIGPDNVTKRYVFGKDARNNQG